jgi:hypothetical protein
LLDPFGRPIEPLSDVDLKGGIVSIVLDVPFGGNGEGVLIVLDLFVKMGDGVVEGLDGGFVHLFLRLDGGGEGADDVDQQHSAAVVEVALGKEGSTTGRDGDPHEVGVVEHWTGVDEPK